MKSKIFSIVTFSLVLFAAVTHAEQQQLDSGPSSSTPSTLRPYTMTDIEKARSSELLTLVKNRFSSNTYEGRSLCRMNARYREEGVTQSPYEVVVDGKTYLEFNILCVGTASYVDKNERMPNLYWNVVFQVPADAWLAWYTFAWYIAAERKNY